MYICMCVSVYLYFQEKISIKELFKTYLLLRLADERVMQST
jgi:hypothetical protein